MRLFIASVICRCSPRSCRDYSRPPGARMSDHWSLISTDAQHDRTQGADGSRAVSRILSFIDFLLRCPPGGSPDPPARQAARDERSDNALGPLMPSLAMQAPVPAKLARACSLGALAASTDPRAAAATYPAALLRHHPGVALKPRPRARHCLRRRHCIPTPSQSPVPGLSPPPSRPPSRSFCEFVPPCPIGSHRHLSDRFQTAFSTRPGPTTEREWGRTPPGADVLPKLARAASPTSTRPPRSRMDDVKAR
jgi:hypothetical protein